MPTTSQTSRRALSAVAIMFIAVLLALGNILCHALVVQELTGTVPAADGGYAEHLVSALATSVGRNPQFVWFFSGAPIIAGLVLVVLLSLWRDGSVARGATWRVSDTSDASVAGALRLLGLLQQEGRLIDFLEENIEPYSDAQVGAAARAIHDGCRNALRQRVQIERIYAQDEGSSIEVGPGYDPAQVRLTGNVHGTLPFRGLLQHGGWRAAKVDLPDTTGVDPNILAPAEVEIE